MKMLLLTLPLALLAACDASPDVNVENASVEEVANQVASTGGEPAGSDNFIRPGLWSTKVTVSEIDMPGMPTEMRERMRSMMTTATAQETCLKPEDVKRPSEDFFAGTQKNCRYDHFRMGDGRIDAAMRCAGEGVTRLMAMKGTYSPDSYNMEMTSRAEGPATERVGAMTMTMKVESTRVGDCPATDPAAN